MKKLQLIRTSCDGHYTYGYLRMPDGEEFDTIEKLDRAHSELLKPLMNLPAKTYFLKVQQNPVTLYFYFGFYLSGDYRHAAIYPTRPSQLRGGAVSVQKEGWSEQEISSFFHDYIEEYFIEQGSMKVKKGDFQIEISYSPTFIVTKE